MNKDRYAYGYEVSLNIPTQSVPVITDTLNEKQYYSLKEVVELLNGYEMLCLMLININSELHDTITKIIHKDEISINTMMSNMEKLEKENKQLKQEHKIAIDEMITDYKKLEKENKQLQAELDSFRPVLFHDMRIGTITLYSKGGIDE